MGLGKITPKDLFAFYRKLHVFSYKVIVLELSLHECIVFPDLITHIKARITFKSCRPMFQGQKVCLHIVVDFVS